MHFRTEITVREKLAIAEEVFRLIVFVGGFALILITTFIRAWNELVGMVRAW